MLGKTLVSRYKVTEELGQGGFGQTFIAEDMHLPSHPKCVIKQLKPIDTRPFVIEAAKKLFDREAQTLYKLGKHSQIPELLAHFEDGTEFYLVQELIEGIVLSQEIAPGKQSSESFVFWLLQEVLQVLSFVHQQNVIHRDIKPSNLIRRNSDGKIVLIDFGAVKEINIQAVDPAARTNSTIAIGSPGYMPDEQANGKPKFSSDIYATGMMCIQALTGVIPNQLSENTKTGEIIWRDRVPSISTELADFLDKMTRRHFAQRFETGTEALAALVDLPKPNALSSTIVSSQTTVISPQPPITPDLPSEAVTLSKAKTANLSESTLAGQKSLSEQNISNANKVSRKDHPPETAPTGKTSLPLPLVSNEGGKQENSKSSDFWHKLPAISGLLAALATLLGATFTGLYQSGLIGSKPTTSPSSLVQTITPVQTSSSDPTVMYTQGLAKYNSKDYAGAIADYTEAIRLKPDYKDAYKSRASTKITIRDFNGAIADCNEYIRLDPNNGKVYFDRGYAKSNLGDKKGAVSDYTEAIRLDPNVASSHGNRGSAKRFLGDYQGAVSDYTEAIRLDPNFADYYKGRGRAKSALGDKKGAEDDFNKANQLPKK
ncbi:serine/threonine-protein kinase [Tumidithrix elongata RA019]|uniref:non-specific serine/threonine protein kinase n=1 Tax=Tumidithrix elongata BACA0141 TaxID=2716417 RepID=A0AAW9Q5V2_9CYAN|nr:serine/threonine-protein kinase [Tumidithrix elongata RA019]